MAEFKDMRKAWRKKKREAAAHAANSQYMNGDGSWQQPRASFSSSSESDYDRRDSAISMFSTSERGSGSFYGVPTTAATSYSWGAGPSGNPAESRPGTASSVASSVAGQYPMYTQPGASYGQTTTLQPVPERRPSAPQHVLMPPVQSMGFARTDGDHPTPTQQNPFPPQGMSMQQQYMQGQHPGQGGMGMGGNMAAPRQGQTFPFQTLASPMSVAGSGYQQFAFNR